MTTDNSNKRAGNMAEVHGSEEHSLRASEKKARHNKVYTAKGPRDRRVRLSADTAIQFYDVQDRLGYERASEAVDWLIRKARVSIDKLFETSSSSHTQSVDQFPTDGGSSVQTSSDQFVSSMENSSTLFSSYIQGGNCANEMGFSQGQAGCEQKGQIQRMFMMDQETGFQSNGGVCSDEIVKFYISGQGFVGDQELNVGFNQQHAFLRGG